MESESCRGDSLVDGGGSSGRSGQQGNGGGDLSNHYEGKRYLV